MRAVTVTLGDMTNHAQRHLASGRFASMSEVVRAGLRALDREKAAIDELLRVRVSEAIADPRPTVATGEASAAVRAAVAQEG